MNSLQATQIENDLPEHYASSETDFTQVDVNSLGSLQVLDKESKFWQVLRGCEPIINKLAGAWFLPRKIKNILTELDAILKVVLPGLDA